MDGNEGELTSPYITDSITCLGYVRHCIEGRGANHKEVSKQRIGRVRVALFVSWLVNISGHGLGSHASQAYTLVK